MSNLESNKPSFSPFVTPGLTTAHVADACVKVGVQVRCAPSDVQLFTADTSIFGKVRPARHYGSVDVFLEALELADPGDILVIDNGGRHDEACIGDLVALETKAAGLCGIVVWGLHRDVKEIREIDLPVFSQGTIPTGPLELRERDTAALLSARVGSWTVDAEDAAMADGNGVIFIPMNRADELLRVAKVIYDREHCQANKVRDGETLRTQFRFREFLAERSADRTLTFRKHLRRIGGAIEE